MSRYSAAFGELRRQGQKAFIPFFVIGDPDYATSLEIVKTAVDAGADMLELGLAFSDPIADGPTIQAADLRALRSGIRIADCFRFIEEVRRFTSVPIGLLVYVNLILKRGVAGFFRQAAQAGVDGILAADVPIEESSAILEAADRYGVDPIFMVTPATTPARLARIARSARGFIYLVALLGVTGARGDLDPETVRVLRRVRSVTDVPVCVGFGISRPEHVAALARSGADGAIVGSAIIDVIARNLGDKKKMIREVARYVAAMKAPTRASP